MIKQLVFACFVACIAAEVVHNYRDCGSRDSIINSIDISPCPKEPCFLKRGTNVSIAINFKSKVDTTHVKTAVHGILGFLPIPFPVASDACANHNVDHCPLQSGETVVYQNAIFVKPIYPKVRVSVKYEVKDDHGRLVCFIFPTEIVD